MDSDFVHFPIGCFWIAFSEEYLDEDLFAPKGIKLICLVTICYNRQTVSAFMSGFSRSPAHLTPCRLHFAYFGQLTGCRRISYHHSHAQTSPSPPWIFLVAQILSQHTLSWILSQHKVRQPCAVERLMAASFFFLLLDTCRLESFFIYVCTLSWSCYYIWVIAYDIDTLSLITNLFSGSCHTIPVLAQILFCWFSSNRLPQPACPCRLSIFIAHITSFATSPCHVKTAQFLLSCHSMGRCLLEITLSARMSPWLLGLQVLFDALSFRPHVATPAVVLFCSSSIVSNSIFMSGVHTNVAFPPSLIFLFTGFSSALLSHQ